MNKRTAVVLLAWILCIVSGGAVWLQQKQLVALRGQPNQIEDKAGQPNERPDSAFNSAEVASETGSLPEASSHELLQLRSQVTRLTARKRELAGVPGESERLRAQLSNSATNAPGGIRLPPGYLRKAEAQLVGYSTPENTLQSFLWALQHHDATNVLQALMPDEAQNLAPRLQPAADPEKGFFKSMDPLPGMAIESRQDLPDGSVELQVAFGPGLPSQKVRLRPLNGEWKLLEARF